MNSYQRHEVSGVAAKRHRQHQARRERCAVRWDELSQEDVIGELLREARRDIPPALRVRLIKAATTAIQSGLKASQARYRL